MKMILASAWLTLVVVAVVSAGSCSVNHRSETFEECTGNGQGTCSSGKRCSNGLCVSTSIDAGINPDGKPLPDALVCPTQCTSCKLETMECKIDCAISPASCVNLVVCPEGWNCDINCTTQNSCRNGINCVGGASCDILCQGNSSCRNISCGVGRCNTICSGSNSCRNIQCGQSCSCDVDCQLGSLCDTVVCAHAACDDSPFSNGCNSLAPGCDTCP